MPFPIPIIPLLTNPRVWKVAKGIGVALLTAFGVNEGVERRDADARANAGGTAVSKLAVVMGEEVNRMSAEIERQRAELMQTEIELAVCTERVGCDGTESDHQE